MARYTYVGKTDHKGRQCDPVMRADDSGLCVINAQKNAGPRNQLIKWADTGELCCVPARCLRLNKNL
jgi:hypothetical protein